MAKDDKKKDDLNKYPEEQKAFDEKLMDDIMKDKPRPDIDDD